MILTIGVEIPLMYTVINHLDNFTTFIEAVLEQAAIIHGIFNIIFHKANYHHIQVISTYNILCYTVSQISIRLLHTHTHTHTRARARARVYYLCLYV